METNLVWRNLELFQGLKEGEIQEILDYPGWIVRTYGPGSSVHDAGESLDSLIILTKGQVEGSIITETGRSLNLTRRTAPYLIGPAMVFGDNREYLKIKATCQAELMKLSKDRLKLLFSSHPLLLENFLRICANRFHYLSSRVELLGFHSIRKKISHYLLDQYELHGVSFPMERSMTSLAEHMGAERPSLSTVFHKMKREGIFRMEGKMIYIDELKRLKEELERD